MCNWIHADMQTYTLYAHPPTHTGTPAGVGKVTEGQVIHAGIRGISESTISFVVTQRKPPQAFTLDHQNPFRVSKL